LENKIEDIIKKKDKNEIEDLQKEINELYKEINENNIIKKIIPTNFIKKNDIITKNIMFMLSCLFPTQYPFKNNIFDTYSSFINNSIGNINITISDLLPGFISKNINPDKSLYSYLKIDGKIYTLTQVIWVNDIYNHTKYNELITKYIELNKWKNGEKKQIMEDIQKKYEKIIKSFNEKGAYKFTKEDIEILNKENDKIEKKYADNRTSLEKSKYLDIKDDNTILINKVNELNIYSNIEVNDIEKIMDIATVIIDKYKKISNNISIPSNLQKKFSELKSQVDSLTVLYKINDKYISKEGINSNIEKDDSDIVNLLKSKYTTYTNFVENIKEFVKPKRESTNIFIQQSLENFLENTETLPIFNALMQPSNINKNINTIFKDVTPEQKKYIENEEEVYKNRMNTGVSILQKSGNDPKYEIIIRVDIIAGEVNDENKKKIDCLYQGESLYDTMEKLLNSTIINSWELNKERFFIDMSEKIKKIEDKKQLKKQKDGDKDDHDEGREEKDIVKEETMKGGFKKVETFAGKKGLGKTRNLKSILIKTRKRYYF